MNQKDFIDKAYPEKHIKNNYENAFNSLQSINVIKNNTKKASKLIETNNLQPALDLLNKNLALGAKDAKTFDLFVQIYKKMNDYSELIKILNVAIKKCEEKNIIYRQIKKEALLKKMLSDIEDI
jgi:hypothetical protein